MKRPIVAAAVTAVLCHGAPALTDDHLVSLDLVATRFAAATEQRSRDLAAARLVLSSPSGHRWMAAIQFTVDPRDTSLSRLSDFELYDLSDRAARLEVDPRAAGVGKALLIVLVIVGIAFAAALIVCSDNGCV